MGSLLRKAHRIPVEDMIAPVPDSGVKLFLFLLRNHFWKMANATLLCILFALPIITAPASFAALNRVYVKLIRDGNCFLWEEFKKEFTSSFSKALFAGLLLVATLFFCYYCLSMCISNQNTIYGIFYGMLGALTLQFAAPFFCYVFVMFPMLDLPLGTILGNAWRLVFAASGRSLAILGICALCAFLGFVLFPLSLFAAVFGGLALAQFALCFLAYGAVWSHVIVHEADSESPSPV